MLKITVEQSSHRLPVLQIPNSMPIVFFYNSFSVHASPQIKIIKNIHSDDNMIKGIEIISKDKNSNDFNYFYLSTFFHAYNTRRSYYDKIVKSYKIN